MKALHAAQMAIGAVQKNAANPFHKTKYADLAAIQDGIEGPAADNGLMITQIPTGEKGLSTLLMHLPSGEWQESVYEMPKAGTSQDAGSGITYARRQALAALFQIKLKDDDGNAASGKEPRPKQSSAERSRKHADKLADNAPYKQILEEIQGLRAKLKDVEPEKYAADKFYNRQKQVLGLETADDLANFPEKGREMLKSMERQLNLWKNEEAMGVSTEDIVPGLTARDFATEDYPLVAEWIIKGKKAKIGDFLARWEGTADDALQAARSWKEQQ